MGLPRTARERSSTIAPRRGGGDRLRGESREVVGGAWPTEWVRFLELFGVCRAGGGAADVRPARAKNADLFTSRRVRRGRAHPLRAAVLLVPPIALYADGGPSGRSPRRSAGGAHALVMAPWRRGVFVIETVKHAYPAREPVAPDHRNPAGWSWRVTADIASTRCGPGCGPRRRAGDLRRPLPLRLLGHRRGLRPHATHEPPRSGSDARTAWCGCLLDEFPETSLLDGNGGVDAALFPHFAEFAASHRTGTGTRPRSRPSRLAAVPGMLTSSYPNATNGVPRSLRTTR